MSILDKIAKRNFMRVGDTINAYGKDWDTLLRLAGLAERAHQEDVVGRSAFDKGPSWQEQVGSILYPPAPTPPESVWDARDDEIVRLREALERICQAMEHAYHGRALTEARDALRGGSKGGKGA